MHKPRLRRSKFLLLGVLLIVGFLPLAASSATQTTIVNANADGYTSSWRPTTSFGRSGALTVSRSYPTQWAYLRFNVSVSAPISRAWLEMYSWKRSTSGVAVYSAGSSWSERRLTYRSAPWHGSTYVRSGRFGTKRWLRVDVTRFIKGSGTYTLAVRDLATTALSFSSREGKRTPHLRIVTTPTVSPSPSPSLSSSPLPTDSPTIIPSSSPSDSPSPSPSDPPSSSPTATPLPSGSLVTDPNAVFSDPQIAKLGYMQSFVDPNFDTTITRIAANAGTTISYPDGSTGTWGSDVRQHYNTEQAWNADGSMLWLENSSGGSPSRLILDGNTYQPLMKPCSNYSYYDDRWHPTLPHVRISWDLSGNIQWFDMTTCTQLRHWTAPFALSMDPDAGPSRDGSMWALGDATRVFVIRMDPLPGLIGPAFNAYTNCGLSDCTIDHVTISASGKYVDVHYAGDHDRIFDVNPTTLALTPHVYPSGTPECSGHSPSMGFVYDTGHADVTYDDQGNDILVAQNRSWCPQTVNGAALGQIYSVRLSDGFVRSLIRPDTAQAYHISCRNFDRPGWCYAWFWPASGKPFNDEVIAYKLDGSGQVERLANTHTDTNGCYRCEAHPVPSLDGTRVLMASSWSLYCGSVCGTQTNPQVYVIDTRSLR